MRLKIFCGFLLFIFACSKSPWKQPTSINFELALSSTSFLTGDLLFHTGYMNLGSFVFDGARQQGGDVYFDTDYDKAVQVPLKGTATASSNSNKLTFDVPQGVYTDLLLHLGTADKPSDLVLEGDLTLDSGDPVFVRLELQGVERWSVVAKNQARQQQGLTLEGISTNATIVLQPQQWILENQRSLWEAAELEVINGRMTLLINAATNIELYRTISKLFIAGAPCAFVES
jgi:hypothetical protein